MQGRRDAQRRAAAQQRAALHGNDSGKFRSIPQRPATMARLDQPPATPRVARPQRSDAQPASCHRRLLTLGIVAIVCILLAFILGYAAINFFAATNASADAATTATDFIAALHDRNYDQAYNDLGPAITIPLVQDDFKQQAQNDDLCFGTVTNYSEIASSALQNSAQSYSFDFSITRSKILKPYTLHLLLQQDTTTGRWQVNSYGDDNNLAPGQASCT